ncbi:hypothetical protein OIU78_018514 [Salix suchowensis]|nr:hypothetical protein OIU78_018514 [Salix suchowensis]
MAMIIFLAFSLLFHGALGELICEQLPVDLCSYSIATSGQRCLLENFKEIDGTVKYQCKTSEIFVDTFNGWIESDECVSSCGLHRETVGVSSDNLLEPQFLARLCSDECYQACPNIVDLYSNMALGEGTYLPALCANPCRAKQQARSNGDAAPATGTVAQAPEAAIFGRC